MGETGPKRPVCVALLVSDTWLPVQSKLPSSRSSEPRICTLPITVQPTVASTARSQKLVVLAKVAVCATALLMSNVLLSSAVSVPFTSTSPFVFRVVDAFSVSVPPASIVSSSTTTLADVLVTVWPFCTNTAVVDVKVAGPGVPTGNALQMGSLRLPEDWLYHAQMFTFSVALLPSELQGPAPSGSSVVHVSVTNPPTSVGSGVYVVLALLAFAKLPKPPLQLPEPFVVALMFTAVVPQVVYGPFALAVAGVFTFNVALLPRLVQGPAPSGSFVVQVSVTDPPTSVGSGVYVVLALLAFAKLPKPPLQLPEPFAVALMFTAVPPHVTYGPPALAVAAGFTVIVVWQLLLQPAITKR